MPSLMAFLGLDGTAFNAGLRKAQTQASTTGAEIKSSLGGALAGFGGALGAGALINSAIEAASHIRQLSKEFRVSTDTIQEWDRGAHKVGMSAEDIGNAFNRLKKAREAAITKGDVGGFGSFGIGLDDLKNSALSTEDIMDRMRESASGHPITDQEDVAGMELMGKSGAKVLSAMQEIHNLGKIDLIPKEDIEALHEAEATLNRIKREATISTAKVLGPVAEGTQKVIDSVAQGIVGIGELFKGNWKFNEKEAAFGPAEAASDQAPMFDLKGRQINAGSQKRKEPAPEEKENHYAITKTIDLNKDAKEIEKERVNLLNKIAENHFKTLTVLQRQAALKKEIAVHERQAIEEEFQGNDIMAIRERMEAERLRGELKIDRKAERMDFSSVEKIGAFANVSALHSAGMDHAAKTAQHTHDTFVAVKELVSVMRGYVRDPKVRSRVDITHQAVQF